MSDAKPRTFCEGHRWNINGDALFCVLEMGHGGPCDLTRDGQERIDRLEELGRLQEAPEWTI